MIADNLLQSIGLLANAARALADRPSPGFKVNRARIAEALDRNPILVTALNPVIGYEKGAAIAKKAYAEGRPIREVAREMTELSQAELVRAARSCRARPAGASRAARAAVAEGVAAPGAGDRDWGALIRARLAGTEPRHEVGDWIVPGSCQGRMIQTYRKSLPPEPTPAAVLIPIIEREPPDRAAHAACEPAAYTTAGRSVSRAGASKPATAHRRPQRCARRARRSGSRSAACRSSATSRTMS